MVKFKSKMVEIDAVRVMVADYNGQTWDGPPFSEMPGWLSAAIETGMVVPVTRECTPRDNDVIPGRALPASVS